MEQNKAKWSPGQNIKKKKKMALVSSQLHEVYTHNNKYQKELKEVYWTVSLATHQWIPVTGHSRVRGRLEGHWTLIETIC